MAIAAEAQLAISQRSRRKALAPSRTLARVACVVVVATLLVPEQAFTASRLGRHGTGEAPARGALVARHAAKKKTTKKAAAGKVVSDGDLIFLKGVHTGNFLNTDAVSDDVKARTNLKADRAEIIIEKLGGGEVQAGDQIYLRGFRGGYIEVQGEMVRLKRLDRSRCEALTITKKEEGPVCEGDTVFIKGGNRGTYFDFEGQDVRARWPDEGDWQKMIVEFK